MLLRAALVMSLVFCAAAHAAKLPRSPDEGPEYDVTPDEESRASALKVMMRAKPGTPYATLRKRVIAAGFKPVPAGKNMDRCIPELAGNCRSYPETVACKSAGGSDCSFVFDRDGSWFVVATEGWPGAQRVQKVNWLSLQDQKDLQASIRQ